jgi:PTS system nitrogen regulatory IIA component
MPLNDLLAAHAVLPALKIKNKKQALQELAARAAAECGRSEREIFETLLHRERLGSTGVGRGPGRRLPRAGGRLALNRPR